MLRQEIIDWTAAGDADKETVVTMLEVRKNTQAVAVMPALARLLGLVQCENERVAESFVIAEKWDFTSASILEIDAQWNENSRS